MLSGKGFTIISLLALAALLPVRAMACDFAPVRPVIHVTAVEAPVKFDTSRPIAALNEMGVNKAPYASHYHADIGGMMNGAVTVEHNMTFRTQEGDSAGQTCLILSEIGLRLSIDPTIYIASEFRQQACLFKEIFDHESKHVAVDRALVEKYRYQFIGALNLVLMMPADYLVTDISPGGIDHAQKRIQAEIESAIEVMFAKMMAERAERQLAVDSHDEYGRIARTCQPPSSS